MTFTPKIFALVSGVLISCGLLPFTIRATTPPAEITAAVDSAFRPLMAQYGVPGIAIAVSIAGQQYFFNYGVASKNDNRPVTKDTLFEIGSVSKTFTATLTAYACTLGKLSLDDHPAKYMPQLRRRPIDHARLLNLGTYTAGGLPLQFPDSVVDDAGMETYFQQWKPSSSPGERRQYSNPSIGLLGYITALAMRRDFADLVEKELFRDLGLTHSFIRVPEAAMSSYAWGYNRDGNPVRVSPGVFDMEAYGVKSTAADMIRFVDCNMRPAGLKPPLRRAIHGTQVGYFKVGDMVQGLGWEQYPYPIGVERLLAGNSDSMIMEANAASPVMPPRTHSEPALFDKTGSTGGFGAYVAFVPADNIGIVMLANRNFPIPARVAAAYSVLRKLSSGGAAHDRR